MWNYKHKRERGMTLVEMLVTVFVFTLIFAGLFAGVQYTLKLLSLSKAKTTALAVANQQIEYIRSLSYDQIGTIAGIPNGPIPQNSTVTQGGASFNVRVLIEYIDAPEDGTGASDSNGILADYKLVKVEVQWEGTEGTQTTSLLTTVTPPSIETTSGGGTLLVNVFDAHVNPVPGAAVRVYNNTTTSTIDTTRYTDASGIAYFSGAPAAANYQITVTKAGYSTDGTYVATTSNPSPTTLPVAVVVSRITTMNFQIDQLSDLRVKTIAPPSSGTFSDSFENADHIATSSNVSLVSDELVLSGAPGTYSPVGVVYATATTPSSLAGWKLVDWTAITSTTVQVAVRVYSVTGSTTTLIPDSDLPGNTAGFTSAPIDLRSLSTSTYPSLMLVGTLTTSDSVATPHLSRWSLSYNTAITPISSVPFILTNNKTIGTSASSSPVYKYSALHTTDGNGEVALTDLEWGSYTLTLNTSSYDIAEACNDVPYILEPGVDETLTLTLASDVSQTLRVSVVDISGNPIYGASVELSRPGHDSTKQTSLCGQTFFNSGLTSALDYRLEVRKTGYTTQITDPLSVNGDTTIRVTLVTS